MIFLEKSVELIAVVCVFVAGFLIGRLFGKAAGFSLGVEATRESAEAFYQTAKEALNLQGLVVEMIDSNR